LSHCRGIILKSAREIERIRAAGRVVNRVLTQVREMARPGVTTAEMNALAECLIAEAGGLALFKGVVNPQARFAFPAVLCTSVNHELVHGIPNDRPLKEGDIVGVDCGVKLEGYCGDSATTVPIGRIASRAQELLDVTRGALDVAIDTVRPGRMWSEVAREIQSFVERHDFSVVREFVGHGIGRDMHEEPKVPNYWDRRQNKADFQLAPGVVLAIEPMVNEGTADVVFGDEDRWVVVTRDGKLCAHFEHTVAVTETGADVLTDGR